MSVPSIFEGSHRIKHGWLCLLALLLTTQVMCLPPQVAECPVFNWFVKGSNRTLLLKKMRWKGNLKFPRFLTYIYWTSQIFPCGRLHHFLHASLYPLVGLYVNMSWKASNTWLTYLDILLLTSFSISIWPMALARTSADPFQTRFKAPASRLL